MAEELSPREEVGRDEELLADERERSPVSTRFAAARDGASLSEENRNAALSSAVYLSTGNQSNTPQSEL